MPRFNEVKANQVWTEFVLGGMSSPELLKRILGLQNENPDWNPEMSELFRLDLNIPGKNNSSAMMDFRLIPAGTLTLKNKEGKSREVFLESFYMAATVVTVGQWYSFSARSFISQHRKGGSINLNSYRGIFNMPLTKISWNGAKNFCDEISKGFNLRCSLPTEIQWEYACRAGTTTPFNFGEFEFDKINCLKALADRIEVRSGLARVRSFPPNAWGLYEMHGNVWERCLDSWRKDIVIDPEEAEEFIDHKVIRGGSWANLPGSAESHWRQTAHINNADEITGFRPIINIINQ